MIIKFRKVKIENNEVLKNNSKIREFINKIGKFRSDLLKNKRSWSIVCSCLDTIRDTEEAIKYYKKLKKVNYLELAGILQVLFLQSDAIKNLYDAFIIGKCDISQELNNVREIRNKSTGHPTKRTQGSCIVMPNHIHFIININHTTNVSLFQIIKGYKQFATKSIRMTNPNFQRQKSYYEHIIRDEFDLARIQEYIHNNPGKRKEDKLYKM